MKKKVLIVLFLFLFLSLSSSLSSSGVLLNKRWRAQIKDALGIKSLEKQADCSTVDDKEELLEIITGEKTCPPKSDTSATTQTPGTSGTVSIPGTSGTVTIPGTSGTTRYVGSSGTTQTPGTSGTVTKKLCDCYYWSSGEPFNNNVTINFKNKTIVYKRFQSWGIGIPEYAEFFITNVSVIWDHFSTTRLTIRGDRYIEQLREMEYWTDIFDYVDFGTTSELVNVSGNIADQIGSGKKFKCTTC